MAMLLILTTWASPTYATEELPSPGQLLDKNHRELVTVNSLADLKEPRLSKIDGPLALTSYSLVLADIYFDEERHLLSGDVATLVEDIVRMLKSNRKWRLHIEAHCDERGTEAYNVVLGDRRMQAVEDFILYLGVEPHRLRPTSYGQEKPGCPVSTQNCWEENLRVQLGFQVLAPRHSYLGCLVRLRLLTQDDRQNAFQHLLQPPFLQPLHLAAFFSPARGQARLRP